MNLVFPALFFSVVCLTGVATAQEKLARKEDSTAVNSGLNGTPDNLPTRAEFEALKEELDHLRGKLDGLDESYIETKGTVDALKKIKVSGYIQAQYQTAETAGQATFAGGNFPSNVKQRFAVRRGRVKVNYDNDLTQYVLQIDVTQGGVGIKDAYASFREPWLKTFGLTAGVFDRPFGFEISYSSSNRETPERSRIYQTLFPGERDLGAKMEIVPRSGPLTWLSFKGGFFNGSGPTANDYDSHKDFIGRLGAQVVVPAHGLAIDVGGSAYLGGVRQPGPVVYKNVGILSSGVKGFLKDSSAANIGAPADRNYVGVDAQLYYDLPMLGGLTLRGEFITGNQTGTFSSSTSPSSQPTEIVIRNFNGGYVYYVQNIGLSNQFVLKYDWYDPNIDADAAEIGAPGSNFSLGDIKYSTLGIGWIYHWDANIKLMAYYDIVKNEQINPAATGALASYSRDLKDNVLTLRIQYKF